MTQQMLDATDKRLFVGIGILEAFSQLLGFLGASKLPGLRTGASLQQYMRPIPDNPCIQVKAVTSASAAFLEHCLTRPLSSSCVISS